MKNKFSNALKLIFPYKKINLFVISLFFLGITLGAIFTATINVNDQNLIIEKIKLFISNIDNSLLDTLFSVKNSLSINFTYLFFIWILGMTIIGVVINLLLLFLKGFIIGFSLASFIVTYSYKGLILSSLYLIFGQLLNIFVVCTIAIYSIIFSYKLLQVIFKNKNIELKRFVKNYTLIAIILSIISIISSFGECILFPTLIKLIINLFT